jgi:hypothetical protein
VPGSGGIFDVVTVDDTGTRTPIFSKHEEGRFPDESEILDAL